jgi:hypothetical protein
MRLKPVNGPFGCIERGAIQIILATQPPPKVAGNRLSTTILREIRN